ncbi:LPS export ABC transporter periplasmic protein LptC [Fuchsiella alkaliacetigena]|uniref:LPS export ABC transporter periplasmic protein LptC n=1 Tax=Fuchsiella alkaliacetigena TaxID=957042 RepID=UPI002009F4D4|nr:LPS export ABC transporter periplasmic protein LptC [Fuchsiella alkaliacetigena]MCK8824282.1 LPS export ABC transporter periplasmic protein LptC [Fuchsiella alkaliacetigena]
MKRWGVVLLVVLLITGSFIYLYTDLGEETAPPPADSEEQTEEVPETEVSNAELTVRSLDGESRLILKAEKIVRVADENRLDLQEVLVEIYEQGAQELSATLEAESGVFLPSEGRLEFFAPLKVTGRGMEVQADTLNWERRENRWSGEGNVVIINQPEEIKLTGGEFVAYLDFDRLQVKENVHLSRLEREEGESGDG